MKIEELKKGDVLLYRCGATHLVNHPHRYKKFYKDDMRHTININFDIMEIKRFKRNIFGLYRLKIIYKR